MAPITIIIIMKEEATAYMNAVDMNVGDAVEEGGG